MQPPSICSHWRNASRTRHLRKFCQVVIDAAEWRMMCILNVLAEVFSGFANIKDSLLDFAVLGCQLLRGNGSDGSDFLAFCSPSCQTSVQVAQGVIESDPRQPCHNLFLSAFRSNQDDVFGDVDNELTYPGCKVAIDADEDAIGEYALPQSLGDHGRPISTPRFHLRPLQILQVRGGEVLD